MITGERLVVYNNKFYFVFKFSCKGKEKLSIIDGDDYDKMFDEHDKWYLMNGYVGHKYESIKGYYGVFLHNLVMNKSSGGGKGQKITIDHISRNTMDNRKANLRLADKTLQNENRRERIRTCELPENCGIEIEDIPKCVYYSKPQSGHGEMFVIELKKHNKKTTWKSSSSVKISLKDKLIEIKKKLVDISKEYPELMENKTIFENYTDEQINLMKEFNEIIKLSGFKCVEDNLMEIPKKKVLKPNINEANEEIKNYLKTTNTAIKTGRKHRNNLPNDCDITPDMIPKYCYYQAETDKRGDAFIIDRHPALLEEGKRQWKTSGSKKVSTECKFKELKFKLRDLEKTSKNKSGSKTSKLVQKKSTSKSSIKILNDQNDIQEF